MKSSIKINDWQEVNKNGRQYWQFLTTLCPGPITIFNKDLAGSLADFVGKFVEVEHHLNDKGYEQIDSIIGPGVVSPSQPFNQGQSSTSNKDRDKYIIRQSCLKAAIECVISVPFENRPSTEDTLKLAEKLEAWVLR